MTVTYYLSTFDVILCIIFLFPFFLLHFEQLSIGEIRSLSIPYSLSQESCHTILFGESLESIGFCYQTLFVLNCSLGYILHIIFNSLMFGSSF